MQAAASIYLSNKLFQKINIWNDIMKRNTKYN